VIRGGGRDAFGLKFGFAEDGATPEDAPEVTVLLGMHYSATVPSSAFTRQGDRFRFRGEKGGLPAIVVDYARRTVTVKGKRVDLDLDEYGYTGESPSGERVILGIAIGDTRFSSMPMWHKAGRKLSY
jgi:hypothetical protein